MEDQSGREGEDDRKKGVQWPIMEDQYELEFLNTTMILKNLFIKLPLK